MKKYKLNVFAVAVTVLSFASCEIVELDELVLGEAKKEITNSNITAIDSSDFINLITGNVSKNWRTGAFTLAGSSQFTRCRLDDVMIFFPDGTYQYSSGSELCNAEDSKRSRTGNWEIEFSNNMIVFDKGSSNEYRADVIGLSTDELRLKGTYMGMEIRGLYSKN